MNKKTRAVMFSSKKQDWETPQDTFDELDKEFHFTLDPCCTEKTAKCKKFYTKKDNGLRLSWRGERVFVNPPFGKEMPLWIEKGFKESRKPKTLVVFLIPARTDTRYFHKYIYKKAEIRFIKGRLKFGKSNNSAPFPSMICILGDRK